MNPHLQNSLITDTDEMAASSKDILLAVSGALRGDRKPVRRLVAKARGRIEKRLRRELRALGSRKPASSGKKDKIRGARLNPPERPPAMAPSGVVAARLPDGRKVRLVLAPAAARHGDMLALRRVNGANTRRAFNAIAHNGRAIDQLAASQRKLADRLSKLQSTGDLALLRGILEGLTHLERRMDGIAHRQDKALGAQKRAVQKRFARQARVLRAQTRTSQIQKLHGTAVSMQSAAYSTPGRLLTLNNFLLAVNQLVGSFAPEITKALGLSKPGVASPLVWLVPLGSLVATQVVLGRRQHERFVSGVVRVTVQPIPALTVTGTVMVLGLVSAGGGGLGEESFSLKDDIAPAEWQAFKKRKDVPVTTVVTDPPDAFENRIWSSGRVSGGRLTIRVIAVTVPPKPVVVSWTVDTRRGDG